MPVESADRIQFEFEEFTVNLKRRCLYRGDERIRLTPTPFKVLEFLLANSGSVVSKGQLLHAVWGGERDENTVEQAIRQIRRALGDEKEQPRFIQTIPGEGYRFIAELRDLPPANVDVSAGTEGAQVAQKRYPEVAGKITSISVAVVGCLLVAAFALRQTSPGLTAVNPIRITRSQTRILSPLLSDGTHIYYPQYENGEYSIAEVPAHGGERSEVATSLTNPELCDMSSVTQAMLLRNLVQSRDTDGPLYVQLKNEPAQKVGNAMAYDAAWYPDAKSILYSADGTVYATDITGQTRRRLFDVPGHAYWFRWSPDGRTIRFTIIDRNSERTSLWEANADGGAPHRLFADLPYHVCCGSWTPDGKFFLFQVRVGDTFQIWARQEHGSFHLPVNDKPFPLILGAMSYRGPLASRDGKKLFVRAEAPKGELVRYDPEIRRFISILPAISPRTLAYSRDSQWIAYTSLTDNNLWRCRADGTQCLQLTQQFKDTVMPRWSPDGQKIAFMGISYQGKWGIYDVAANGGAIHPLSHNDQAKGYPDWSTDGERMVYSDVPPVSQARGIYVLDLRTQKSATLPGSTSFFSPRWSPDGRYLVAVHSGDQYLYLFDFGSGKWRPLAKVPACYPNWSHDGKYVYFRPVSASNHTIFRVEIAHGTIETVANLADVERSPFFMGDWIGLTPDDAPLAIRNSTIEDIYAWNLR